MSYYAGLDVSVSETGLVIIDHTGAVQVAKGITAPIPKNPKWHDHAKRIRDIGVAILQELTSYQLDGIVIEDYAPHFIGAAIPVIELGGFLKVQLSRVYGAESKIQYIAPTVLKKFVTGTGNANKIQVATVLTGKYGVSFRSDNVYDAFGLALFAMGLDTDSNLFNKDQRELLDKHRVKR